MQKTYIGGMDILGAVTGQQTNRAVLIKINNAQELARSQGALASLATSLIPATVEAQVYSKVADELSAALKEKNVDADVKVVEPSGYQTADGKHILSDVGFALGGAGVLAIIWKLFFAGKR